MIEAGDAFDQFLEQAYQAQGILMPQFGVRNVIWQLEQFVDQPAEKTGLYLVFEEKLVAIETVKPADRKELLARAASAIAESAQPAYRRLRDAFRELEDSAPIDGGLAMLPDGEAAYAYALRHHTTTDLTSEEIHELGLAEVARIQVEMADAFDAMGIPEGTLRSRIGQVASQRGTVFASEALGVYATLIEDAQSRLEPLFIETPVADVVMAPMAYAGAAYYVPPSLTGSRPGTFYVGVEGETWRFAMPTLVYHEAVPGHHLQLALAQELAALPSFRRTTVHTAYAEGWALYAERLAWEA